MRIFVSLLFLALVSCAGLPEFASSSNRVDAHWVRQNLILLPASKPTAETDRRVLKVGTDQTYSLSPTNMPRDIARQLPHLRTYQAWQLDISREDAIEALKSHSVIAVLNETKLISSHDLQVGFVLDDLYTSGENDADEINDYGATITASGTKFTLWAPTALNAKVLLYPSSQSSTPQSVEPMQFDPQTGSWSTNLRNAPSGAWYKYQLDVIPTDGKEYTTLEVTDPYSLSLAADGRVSQVVDLNDPVLQPEGWARITPTLVIPEKQIIYAAHIRDFSASDLTVPTAMRGTYEAFSFDRSHGSQHLKALQQAGLNTVQLLPAYDFGGVLETRADRVSLDDTVAKACALIGRAKFCSRSQDQTQTLRQLLASYDPTTGAAQRMLAEIGDIDPYQQGNAPLHFTVPEGSYAQSPNGMSRLLEFRQMVQALKDMNLRVVMDVDYSQTYQSGTSDKALLDKIVPGYYYRLDPTTGTENSNKCCSQTATERVMMAKLMTDSLLVWARDYKIDGFRLDQMSHHPKEQMIATRDAVREIDPDTYFYGEGWLLNDGASHARFRNATQVEMAGSEIGTFTDRLRDAVRGGNVLATGQDYRATQGLGNGLFVYPNDLAPRKNNSAQYELRRDQTMLGLAGNLDTYKLRSLDGSETAGRAIPYGQVAAGYSLDPADIINDVSPEDLPTLWDNNVYRAPFETDIETRQRMQLVSLSFPLFAQGIPKIQMGSELLRSKSFARDSHNTGAWFNAVDFSKSQNNDRAGLPPATEDQANWPLILTLQRNNAGTDRPRPEDIQKSAAMFMDMLKIRSSSRLFAMPTGLHIRQRVKFLETPPGVIVMGLDDGAFESRLQNMDPDYKAMVLVFNHGPVGQTISFPKADRLRLHPVQQNGADERVKRVEITSTDITVPAWTTAIFVIPE